MNPDEVDSFHGIFHRLRHLHFSRSVERMEKLGLNFGQPPILRALWQSDGQTQAELSRQIHRTPATLTALLTRMEHAGWVERRPDPVDHRATRVFLTAKGTAIRPSVEAELHDLDEQTFRGFSETERVLLKRFFVQMEQNLV